MERNNDTTNDEVRLIVENQTIICSRKQLILSSDYFQAMFNANMLESEANEIRLKDVSYESLYPLIRHLHGEQLIFSTDSMCEILSTACMFQFSDAVKTCVRYVSRNITPINCLKIKELSQSLHLVELFNIATKYSLHFFSDVRNSNAFREFTQEQLVNYLSQETLNIESENEVLSAVLHWVESTENVSENFSAEDILDVAKKCVQLKEVDITVVDNPIEDMGEEWKMRFREFTKMLNDASVKINNLPKERYKPQYIVAVAEAETDEEREEPNAIYRFMGKSLLLYDSNKLADQASKRYGSQSSLDNPDSIGFTFDKRIDLPFGEESRNCNGFSLCVLGDRDLYVSGGEVDFGRNKWQRSLWRYDLFNPAKWEEVAYIPSQRRHHGSCCISSDIYLVGGFGQYRQILHSVTKYNTETDEWNDCASLLHGDFSLSCIGHHGKIYACKDKIQCYSVGTDQWSYIELSDDVRKLGVFSWIPLAFEKLILFVGKWYKNTGHIVEYNIESGESESYMNGLLPIEPESVCRAQDSLIGLGQPSTQSYEKAFAQFNLKTGKQSQPIKYDKRLKLSGLLAVTMYL
ncbi:unnamed protein product [Owenia fusiformis]|uniref:BTB domain-containing protein n=1 Tax=Owenia fusiformis TaxID=6347 RepID=A0A8S4N354_OWEFU|nr:unnamed protein product [Owenia fusiformis]